MRGDNFTHEKLWREHLSWHQPQRTLWRPRMAWLGRQVRPDERSHTEGIFPHLLEALCTPLEASPRPTNILSAQLLCRLNLAPLLAANSTAVLRARDPRNANGRALRAGWNRFLPVIRRRQYRRCQVWGHRIFPAHN